MAKEPRNGPAEPARSADGKVTGGSLRKASQLGNARGLSRRLRAKLKREHGSADAYYDWLIEIAANKVEKGLVRVAAIKELSYRIDGKPLSTVDLTVKSEGGGRPLASLTVDDLLALARGKVPDGSGGT